MTVDAALEARAAPPEVASSPTGRILARALRSWELRIGGLVFVFLVAAAVIGPELTSLDPTKMNVRDRFLPPLGFEKATIAHPLGTDQLGRDMLVRSLIGLRYSLVIGILSVALMYVIGCGLGLLAGYKGKLVDTAIMRVADAQFSIPMIILAITILGVSRPTVPAIIVVLALSGWPLYARITRSVVMTEAKREFVKGARIIGASDWRIMALLIAPNVLPPIAFVAVLDVARMMIMEAILGFLGLGVQPPTPTFGNIVADGRKYLLNAWWIATVPGFFLLAALTSLNLVGATLERARNDIYRGL